MIFFTHARSRERARRRAPRPARRAGAGPRAPPPAARARPGRPPPGPHWARRPVGRIPSFPIEPHAAFSLVSLYMCGGAA